MILSSGERVTCKAGCPRRTEAPSQTHETSSVGARPSSAAPVEQKPQTPNTRTLFCRSAAVLGRPRRSEAPTPNIRTHLPGYCSKGASEDGRAPTEELSCVRGCDFCSTTAGAGLAGPD